MAITKYPPNTIHLGGEITQVGDVAAGEVITPGMLVERYNSAGTALFKKHSAAGVKGVSYALNQSMLNKSVDDTYAVGDLMEVAIGRPGTTFWALLKSGETAVNGSKLTSTGDGTLKVVTGGDATAAFAVESVNNTAGPGSARIRVEVA